MRLILFIFLLDSDFWLLNSKHRIIACKLIDRVNTISGGDLALKRRKIFLRLNTLSRRDLEPD